MKPTDTAKKPWLILHWLFFFVLLTITVFIVPTFPTQTLVPIFGVVFFYVVTLFYGLWAIRLHKKGFNASLPLMSFVALVFLGPFGTFGALTMLSIYLLYQLKHPSFEQWHAQLFPEIKFAKPSLIYERIQAGWDDYLKERDIEPLNDLFSSGSLTQKQEILEMIAHSFDPKLTFLLKKALNDPSNTIRVQSASILAYLKKEYENQFQAAHDLFLETPDNTALARAALLKLSTLLKTNLLDDVTTQEYLNQAVELFGKYQQLDPNDVGFLSILGQLLLFGKRPQEAVQWFENTIGDQHIPESLYPYFLEALYATNQFEAFQKKLTLWYPNVDQSKISPNMNEVFQRWMSKSEKS